MWYALFVNGMFYSASAFAELVVCDIELVRQGSRFSGITPSLRVSYITQEQAARFFANRVEPTLASLMERQAVEGNFELLAA